MQLLSTTTAAIEVANRLCSYASLYRSMYTGSDFVSRLPDDAEMFFRRLRCVYPMGNPPPGDQRDAEIGGRTPAAHNLMDANGHAGVAHGPRAAEPSKSINMKNSG